MPIIVPIRAEESEYCSMLVVFVKLILDRMSRWGWMDLVMLKTQFREKLLIRKLEIVLNPSFGEIVMARRENLNHEILKLIDDGSTKAKCAFIMVAGRDF